MRPNLPNTRKSRRGGALAIAMMFFVLITIAGTALLSISGYQRLQTIANGIDVRLMIAAEAGIESVRGRFTVVPVIQEDWQQLLPTAGWNEIETLTVNGINVVVEARPIGGPSVPTARIRSTAGSGTKTRTVEYTIKVATFSDYAVFNASNETSTLGIDYKGVGNLYFGGDVDVPNTGAQIFGKSHIVGEVLQGYGPGNNSDTGQAWDYHFPIEPPGEDENAIPIPVWAAPWTALENVARGTNGHLWAENTLGIQLTGTTYTRYYVERVSGNGNFPSGTNWLDIDSSKTSSTFGPAQRIRTVSSTSGNNWRLRVETGIPIPDEGVIFVKTLPVTTANPTMAGTARLDAASGTNGWTQPTDWGNNSFQGPTGGSWRGTDLNIVRKNGTLGTSSNKVLLLWGWLEDRRVSIGCEHKIILADTISYRTLQNNPQYRIFHGDGVNGKQSPGALGFKEMLGVMSREDCHLTPTWWRPVPSTQVPGATTGDLIPGHHPTDAFPMDGVFFAVADTRPHRFIDGNTRGEFWGHGGLIAGGSYAAGMGNHFRVRNYHWDYRLALTTPPFFLRAYNASAVFLPGTWRTYDS